jgi:uncharacterized protein YbjT (DUF2867 family)
VIVVSGASGHIGGEVLRQLCALGHPVRALSRDPSKLSVPAGATAAKADLQDADSTRTALDGASKLFFVIDAPQLPKAAANVAPLAAAAGVKHIVMVSSGTVLFQPEPVIGRWHREAEETVKASGVAWTFLRPGNFASNSLRWAGSIRAQGSVFGVLAGPSTPIHEHDIADVAVKALTTPGHENVAHRLTGPERMTAADQVAAIGAAIGRELRFVPVPREGALAGMIKGGMPEAIARAVLELQREGHGDEVTSAVRDIAGHPGRTYASWARENAARFG